MLIKQNRRRCAGLIHDNVCRVQCSANSSFHTLAGALYNNTRNNRHKLCIDVAEQTWFENKQTL